MTVGARALARPTTNFATIFNILFASLTLPLTLTLTVIAIIIFVVFVRIKIEPETWFWVVVDPKLIWLQSVASV